MVAYFFAPHVIFLSTLSLRRATCGLVDTAYCNIISIHALLAESDYLLDRYDNDIRISIHALLAESDQQARAEADTQLQFLSTLSLRRATGIQDLKFHCVKFLSTLSLRRATCFGTVTLTDFIFLSTLSLRRATYMYVIKHINYIFLSTLSLRRAT